MSRHIENTYAISERTSRTDCLCGSPESQLDDRPTYPTEFTGLTTHLLTCLHWLFLIRDSPFDSHMNNFISKWIASSSKSTHYEHNSKSIYQVLYQAHSPIPNDDGQVAAENSSSDKSPQGRRQCLRQVLHSIHLSITGCLKVENQHFAMENHHGRLLLLVYLLVGLLLLWLTICHGKSPCYYR